MDWDGLFDDYFKEEPNKDVVSFCSLLKTNAKILDIGVGSARHVKLFLENNFEVFGFDISKKAINIAKGFFSKANLINHDMLNCPWPYEDNFFDGIISINVLHHCNYSEYVKSISEVYRILRKGGFALITMPSKNNHRFQKGQKIDDYTFVTNEGVEKGIAHMYFNEEDIRKLYSKFKIIKLENTITYVPPRDESIKKSNMKDKYLLLIEK